MYIHIFQIMYMYIHVDTFFVHVHTMYIHVYKCINMYVHVHTITMFIRLCTIFQILSRWVGFQMFETSLCSGA
jgi:hypothetical protein